MKVNWKKLRINIPERLRAGVRKYFKIIWVDNLTNTVGKPLEGGTNFVPNREILLNPGYGDKNVVHTLFHEYLHALSQVHEIELTETQVLKLEKTLPYIREFVLTLEKGEKK